jgi:hypothetical protein
MQHYSLSAEINGLQVRVLPGSPLKITNKTQAISISVPIGFVIRLLALCYQFATLEQPLGASGFSAEQIATWASGTNF